VEGGGSWGKKNVFRSFMYIFGVGGEEVKKGVISNGAD